MSLRRNQSKTPSKRGLINTCIRDCFSRKEDTIAFGRGIRRSPPNIETDRLGDGKRMKEENDNSPLRCEIFI
jgi:hypothetical protein